MLLVMATGCGKKADPTTTKNPTASGSQTTAAPSGEKIRDTLRIGSNEDLVSADPFANTLSGTHYFTNLTFNTLIWIDPNTKQINPELATEWKDVSANGDGTAWELTLVQDATYHNGNAFSADDVVFTFTYARDPNNCVKTIAGPGIDAIESVEAVSGNVVRFTLSRPVPDFISYLEHKIYDKESFDTLPKEQAAVIGTGPYYFNKDKTTTGVQFTATRYENYWGGAENHPTKDIVFLYYAEQDTQAAALQADEIDYMGWVSAVSIIPSLKADPNLTVYENDGAFSYYLGMNFRKDLFDDLEIRQAIAMAIDKDAIVAVAYDGYGGTPSYNFCAPVGLGYDPDVKCVGYDPAAAKAIFEKKGWVGKKINLFYPGLAVNKSICEVVQSSLAAVGVQVEVISRDVTNWMALKNSDEYDLYSDTCAYQGALLYNFGRFFGIGGSANLYKYESEAYMAAQDKVNAQPTFDAMVKEFSNLQKFVADDLPIIPLVYNKAFCVARNNVKGVQESLMPTVNYCDYSKVYVIDD